MYGYYLSGLLGWEDDDAEINGQGLLLATWLGMTVLGMIVMGVVESDQLEPGNPWR